MSDQKTEFLTTNLTEQERLSALAFVINKYNHIKLISSDDQNIVSRSKILSIWSDLVLSRKLDLQIDSGDDISNENIDLVLLEKDGNSEVTLAIDVNHNYDENESVNNIELPSKNDAEINLQRIQLIKSAQFQEQILSPGTILSTNLDYANELIELGIAQIIIDHQEKDDVIKLEVSTDLSQGNNDVSLEVNIVSDSSSLEPAENHPADQKYGSQIISNAAHHQDQILIESHQNDFEVEISKPIITPAGENVEIVLAKIFDVHSTDEKSLIEIDNIQPASHSVMHIASISEKSPQVQALNLVRLRLLKTGILHDVVLPEGTVVSTNAADAEELIASGTAERLLIQSDDEDDDDY